MRLTEKQYNFFHVNGYLIVQNFFSSNELNDFKQELSKIIYSELKRAKIPNLSFNNSDIYDKGIEILEKNNHDHVAAIYDTISFSTSFLRLISKRKTQNIINQLLDKEDNDPLYGYTNRCRIDPPIDSRRTYGWHQEVFYTIPESTFIQTWAPLLRNSNKGNGSISIAVGSHKSGIPKQNWNIKEGYADQIIVDSSIVSKYKEKLMELQLGSMLFFNGKAFHKSGNNTSNEVRYSLVGMYHDIDSKFKAPKISFKYRGLDRKEYYEKIKQDWDKKL